MRFARSCAVQAQVEKEKEAKIAQVQQAREEKKVFAARFQMALHPISYLHRPSFCRSETRRVVGGAAQSGGAEGA